MRYAIFSDVHSNLEALTTFLSLIGEEEDLFPVCLGDTAGYSAHPNECLDLLRGMEIPCVIGNHDFAILDRSEAETFNHLARAAIEWQAEVITAENKQYLYSLPWTMNIHGAFCATHADFHAPAQFIYLRDASLAWYSFTAMPLNIGFFGHTHLPGVISMDPAEEDYEDTAVYKQIRGNNHVVELDPDRAYLINPGSLGQPRDLDPRASYTVYDPEARKVTFKRFQYDCQKEADRIIAADLPELLALRLFEGR